MNWQELLTDAFNRIPEFVTHVLTDMKQEDLDWRPRTDSNSIGWLVWHITRQQDAQISDLMGARQIWIEDHWAEKFGRNADPSDHGFGHTPEDVADFRSPDIPCFLDYLRATVNRTTAYIQNLSEHDLDRELNEPEYTPLPTVGVRLISILDDSVLHAGQAAYVRGLIQGKGWQKY